MWWALGASVSVTVIVAGLAIFFGKDRSRLAAEVGKLHGEIENLKARILDQANLLELLAGPDPTLDELRERAARAVEAAGGRVPGVES